jgi:hypothetical protein
MEDQDLVKVCQKEAEESKKTVEYFRSQILNLSA